MAQLHATCVEIDGRGVLLMGKSGSGKSDLALRLIDRGAALVADDITDIEAVNGRLCATCRATIAGQLEVRGIGIVTALTIPATEIALCIALDETPERMPLNQLPFVMFKGIEVPKVALSAFEASTPLKVEKALLLYGLPA